MKTVPMTEALYEYVVSMSPEPNAALKSLRLETAKLPGRFMQIAPEQGAFMHAFAKAMSVRRIVEVGCYTGYSAICLASALPEGGRMISFDVDPETALVARRHFELAKLSEKLELRLLPGTDGLKALLSDFGEEAFDLMFVDADKTSYLNYYELGLKLLRRGGVILVDNVLWGGKVLDPRDSTPETNAIRAFNDFVVKDERVDRALLPIADGIYLLRKR